MDAFRLDLRTTAAPPHGGTDAARYDATDGGGLLHLCDECHDERRAAYAPAAAPHGDAGPVKRRPLTGEEKATTMGGLLVDLQREKGERR